MFHFSAATLGISTSDDRRSVVCWVGRFIVSHCSSIIWRTESRGTAEKSPFKCLPVHGHV